MEDQGKIDPARKAALIGAMAGGLLTLPSLFVAFLSSGGGHGDYQFARVLFPLPMLLTFNVSINPLSLIAALAQCPVYGWIVSRALARSEWKLAAAALALHAVAMILCFSGLLPNFS